VTWTALPSSSAPTWKSRRSSGRGRYGAEGIGLYRSEFLYIQKSPRLPTEEEHLASTKPWPTPSLPTRGRPDVRPGGRSSRGKFSTSRGQSRPRLRGVRLCLRRLDMFRVQLRALLRAGIRGNLSIMFPLVSGSRSPDGQGPSGRDRDDLDRSGVERAQKLRIGVMIEVPSAPSRPT